MAQDDSETSTPRAPQADTPKAETPKAETPKVDNPIPPLTPRAPRNG